MKDFEIPLEMLADGAKELNIELSEDQLRLYAEFARLLVEANTHINLTRITDPVDIVRLHYLDSLTCLAAHIPESRSRAIDIGTGAGFPGLVIKIAMPQLPMTLADATGKKINFVDSTISALNLSAAYTKCARAEELGRNRQFRGQFETVYARALSALPVVAELCLPLLKTGGTLVAQKAGDIDDEVKACKKVLDGPGGGDLRIAEIPIPGTDIIRKIVLISKTKPTSSRYPRPYAEIIKKEP